MEPQMALTNRRGRKRKSGYRESNGRPQREVIDYTKLAAEQPHRRDLPEKHKLSQDADTQIGRLYLKDQISEPQYLAGQEYERRVGAYMATICGPQALAGSGKWSGCRPELCRAYPDLCECARKLRDYQEFHEEIAKCGRRVEMVMKRVVINRLPPGSYELGILVVGLMALCRHMRLTARGKSRYV